MNDRLVVDLELLELERALELGAQLEAFDDALVHRGLEQAVPALAVALRHVHGDVGVPQQLLGILREQVLVAHADADARARVDLLAVDLGRRLELAQQPLGDQRRLVGAGDAVEQDRELVAAEARDRVGRDGSPVRAAARPR